MNGSLFHERILYDKNHIFIQTAGGHLAGRGCAICCGYYVDTNIFIEKANKIHDNKYDYSLIKF